METWAWDGTDWTHQMPATGPPTRDGIGLVFDAARGIVVMAGGWSTIPNGDSSSTWGWDGTNWTKLGA